MSEVEHDAVAIRDGAFIEGVATDDRKESIGFGARVRKTFRKFAGTCNGLCAISTFDLPRLLHAHCQGSSLDDVSLEQDATLAACNVE